MKNRGFWSAAIVGVGIVLGLGSAGVSPAAGSAVTMNVAAAGVEWAPLTARYERVVLTVSGPGGFTLRQELAAGKTPALSLFDDKGQRLADGAYTWQIEVVPAVSPAARKAVAAARAAGDEAALAELSGKLPKSVLESGALRIADGAFVLPSQQEERAKPQVKRVTDVPGKDQVIPDDLIVQGSACIGLDCVNNESFGFDTIRLKENNTRIKFEDTSAGTGFPTTDWQLTANDSASGGANKFSIEDITAATVPFTITGAAPTNSVFVDSTGRVGLRTATPVLDLHIATSNSPAMRLEQNNSGGFTAQTWDIAGNEANFFVRDVTGGSRLPFRIRPGAPTSSIDINASGDVGVGTASPGASLHVSRSTSAIQEMIRVSNNNEARITIQNTGLASTPKYIIGVNNTTAGQMFFSLDGGGGSIFEINKRLDSGGSPSVNINGSLKATNVVFSSSRELKEGFTALDPQMVLSKVASMPISKWHFKQGSPVEHIGPMAEDFHAAFGLNSDAKTISMTDTNGVALAAIQGLFQQVQELQKQNAALTERLQMMDERLQAGQRK
jgi:hypothetical protein